MATNDSNSDVSDWADFSGGRMFIVGSIVALTGVGLLVGSSAARAPAAFLVTINALAQIIWFPAAPHWAF